MADGQVCPAPSDRNRPLSARTGMEHRFIAQSAYGDSPCLLRCRTIARVTTPMLQRTQELQNLGVVPSPLRF